ncbi:MAG TPA: hypothetical protein VGH80_03530 [Xanthomonadaceae bacterium]
MAALLGLASSCAMATLSTDGLEPYAYNEMFLLKVIPGQGHAAGACFFATHNFAAGGKYIWAHPAEAVGNQNGSLDKVFKDRVSISQVQAVNGKDWISINFYWPVASGKEAEKLAPGCGDKPNR